MIHIENLSFKYKNGRKPALDNISLTIHEGDFLGIIGGSGAGKTTLSYAINGVIPHHFPGDFYGSVKVENTDTFDTTPGSLSLKIGSVLQDIDSQMVSFVVEDEILYGLENFSIPGDEIEERLLSALEAVGILPLRYRTIDSLSGGQKQKVAIAAIIALRPKVLILDEPTSELDPKSSEQIFELLKRLNEKYGITIVVIEQKIMLLSEYVKKLAVMNKGRIIFSGNVRDVLGHSSELEEIGIHCPRVVSLSNSLRDRGADVGGVWINLDEAEAGIRRMICD